MAVIKIRACKEETDKGGERCLFVGTMNESFQSRMERINLKTGKRQNADLCAMRERKHSLRRVMRQDLGCHHDTEKDVFFRCFYPFTLSPLPLNHFMQQIILHDGETSGTAYSGRRSPAVIIVPAAFATRQFCSAWRGRVLYRLLVSLTSYTFYIQYLIYQ